MLNPIKVGHFTQRDFDELGLSSDEIKNSYQPSKGAVYHVKGGEGLGKTCWIAGMYRYYIDIEYYTPYDATGNLTFKGKYGKGFTVRKGDALREYLWNMTHVPYTHKIVVISEIDSEFPARESTDKEQSEIARRMWHVQKLDNIIMYDSHIDTEDDRGSTDVTFHKASHFDVYPLGIDWEHQSIDFILEDRLNNYTQSLWTMYDVLRTMLIYNRQELTEDTREDMLRIRPSVLKRLKRAKKIQAQDLSLEPDDFDELDLEKEFNF